MDNSPTQPRPPVLASAPGLVPTAELFFGVELEMFIKPKLALRPYLIEAGFDEDTATVDDLYARANNGDAVRRALALALTDNGLPAQSGIDVDPSCTIADKHTQWLVVDDSTLGQLDGHWRVELVSRILRTTDPSWRAEMDRVFAITSRFATTLLTRDCGMHVHLSPRGPSTAYTMSQVRACLKAMAYFDDALGRIVPTDRRDNIFCRDNFVPPAGCAMSADQVRQAWNYFLGVPRIGWRPLFRAVDRLDTVDALFTFVGDEKSRQWNLSNLDDDVRNTIEWRRPPAVADAASACHWAAVATSLMAAALATADAAADAAWGESSAVPTVGELAAFLADGARLLGPSWVDALDAAGVIADDDRTPARLCSAVLIHELPPSERTSTYAAAEAPVWGLDKVEEVKEEDDFEDNEFVPESYIMSPRAGRFVMVEAGGSSAR